MHHTLLQLEILTLFVIAENYAVAINTKTSYAAFRSLLPSSVWIMKLLSEIANFYFTELWLLPTEIQRSSAGVEPEVSNNCPPIAEKEIQLCDTFR